VDVVDEPAQGVLVEDERARLDARDRLAHVLVEIVEGLDGPRRLDAGLVQERALEVVASERIASSVTTPPALRIMWASPSSRPSRPTRSMRESMHASTATLRAGRSGTSPLSKLAAYSLAFWSRSSVALMTEVSLRSHCGPAQRNSPRFD
jgi:hypothetical protein